MKTFAALSVLLPALALAQTTGPVPQVIGYQGQLKNSNGTPVNSTVDMTFRIYGHAADTTALWTEPHTAATSTGVTTNANGFYALFLGAVTPFPSNLFDGSDRWLGITVGTDPELIPRQRIASVAYAIAATNAAHAKSADSATNATNVTGGSITATKVSVGSGNATATGDISASGNISTSGSVTATSLSVSGIAVNSGNADGGRIYFYSAGNPTWVVRNAGGLGFFPGEGQPTVLELANSGNVGIGTSAPEAKLHVAGGDVKWGNSLLVSDQGGSLELGGNNAVAGTGTPYIDFHYSGLAQDANMRIINNGNGILSVYGGNLAATVVPPSSREFKRNISHLDAAEYRRMLKRLMALDVARYHYKADIAGSDAGRERVGFIAEELPKEVLSTDGKGVDLYELISYSIGAMKAQQGEIEAQRKELQELREQLGSMKR